MFQLYLLLLSLLCLNVNRMFLQTSFHPVTIWSRSVERFVLYSLLTRTMSVFPYEKHILSTCSCSSVWILQSGSRWFHFFVGGGRMILLLSTVMTRGRDRGSLQDKGTIQRRYDARRSNYITWTFCASILLNKNVSKIFVPIVAFTFRITSFAFDGLKT